MTVYKDEINRSQWIKLKKFIDKVLLCFHYTRTDRIQFNFNIFSTLIEIFHLKIFRIKQMFSFLIKRPAYFDKKKTTYF